MANENSNTRRVFFGDNEGAALKFADDHWDRVVCMGYVTEAVKEGEPAGWVISYVKKDSEVSLHPLSDSFYPIVNTSRLPRSKTKASGGV